jgi:hypothetical protein
MSSNATYLCTVCGKEHKGPPLSYAFQAPLAYYSVPKWLRWFRCDLTTDTCQIDKKHFFIIGNIRILVRGGDTTFSWTAWVSLSKQNYERSLTLWNSPGREQEPPYFGWLSSSIPGYPETLNLRTMVHTQRVGVRPEIQLEATDHPLSVEQHTGIMWERVHEIASIANHHIDG